ncbi:MAG: hypothetical protein N2255_00715 [Kiritimatiellae bacterium]|nr:hypothetical protein [Kiritimatiellia bacterium]
MILLRHGEQPHTELCRFLEAELYSLLGEADVDSLVLSEIAAAVEKFVLERGIDRLFEMQTLFALTSRAMLAVGEHKLAGRVLLFGTGLVQPAVWNVAGDGELWVLDVCRIISPNHEFLELSVLSSLNIILDAMAEVWDRTDGHGTLGLRRTGLRHVGAGQTRLVGQERELAAQITDHCRWKLEQLSRTREWQTTPVVINLDF